MARGPRFHRRQSRPRSVALIAWGVLLLGVANGWRALGLYRQSGLFLELDLSPDPRLRLAMAIVWATGFVIAAVSLWLRRRVVRLALPLLLLLYAIYQLGLLGLYALADELRGEWPAVATLYAVTILFTIWVLNRRVGRQYFENSD